jgi:hypothetical protein
MDLNQCINADDFIKNEIYYLFLITLFQNLELVQKWMIKTQLYLYPNGYKSLKIILFVPDKV